MFPRTPGRDYAASWSMGPLSGSAARYRLVRDLGIRRDGSHATHLAVEAEAVVEKPKTMSWEKPPGSAFPLSPRWKGYAAPASRSRTKPCWSLGVNGKVGRRRADRELNGARVIRRGAQDEPYEGHATRRSR